MEIRPPRAKNVAKTKPFRLALERKNMHDRAMPLYTKFYTALDRFFSLRSVRHALASSSRETRAEAIQAVVSLGDKSGVHRALRNADPWVRTAAIKGLARLEGASAARRLVRALADESPEVARTAAECLAGLEGPGVIWALRQCVTAEDWMVRFFGTRGLARIGSPDVIPLLKELQSDAHSWVREEATMALRRLTQGTPAGVEMKL